MLDEATKIVFWEISQHARERIRFKATDLRNDCLVALDEALQVFNGFRKLCILDERAYFLLFYLFKKRQVTLEGVRLPWVLRRGNR